MLQMIKKDELSKIVELTNSVPQDFRPKCFELLLEYYLLGVKQPPSDQKQDVAKDSMGGKPPLNKFVIPLDVKAFLTQYKLLPDVIEKLFYIEGDNLSPIYKLSTHKKAQAELQLAFLMAFESALKTGKFDIDVSSLRAKCEESKCYDSANFLTILKKKHTCFKNQKISNEEKLILSPEGKSELAELLCEMVAEK